MRFGKTSSMHKEPEVARIDALSMSLVWLHVGHKRRRGVGANRQGYQRPR